MAPAVGGHSSSSATGLPGLTTADHQVAASNSTLNAFLGGRQHSWMTRTNSVKPTPRPRSSKQQRPAPRISQTTQDHQQSRNTQSAETITQGVAAQDVAPVTHQLPPRPPQPQHQHLPYDPSHRLPQKPQQRPALSAPILASSTTSTVLPSPAPSDEPSPTWSTSLERQSSDPNDGSPNSLNPPVTAAHFEVVPSPVATVGTPDNTTPAPPGSITPANEQNTNTANESGISSRPPSTAAITLQTPPTPSMPSFSPRTMPIGSTPAAQDQQCQVHANKRRRTDNPQQQPALPLLQSLRAGRALEMQISSYGGEQGLDANVERPRYQLLRDACAQEDIFFVALHQVFCAWSFSPNEAHKLCVNGRHDPSLVDNGFGLMGTILKNNSKLRGEHQHWLMRFPAELDVMRNDFQIYAHNINAVLDFLVRISQYWMVLNHDHKRRGYPLLMDELVGIFLLHSPILQAIVFRASRRTLGVADGTIGSQMDELFRGDQLSHRHQNGSFFFRTTTDFEKEPHNASLTKNYTMLTKQALVEKNTSSRLPYNRPQQSFSAANPQISPQIPQNHNTFTAGSRAGASHSNSPLNTPFPVTSAVPENSSAQGPVPTQYQLPPTQIPVLQSNSPTDAQFTFTPPNNSPVISQTQFHPAGRPGSIPHNSIAGLPGGYQQRQQAILRRSSHQIASTAQSQVGELIRRESLHSPSAQSQFQDPGAAQLQAMHDMLNRRTVSQGPPQSHGRTLMNQNPHFQDGGQSSTLPHNINHGRRVSAASALVPPNASLSPGMASNDTFHNNLASMDMGTRMVHLSSVRPQPIDHRPMPTGSGVNPFYMHTFTPIPLNEYPHDPYERKSVMNALHQAHLRSPRRVLRDSSFPHDTERYYQSIKRLALPPLRIDPRGNLYEAKFNMHEQDIERLSQDASQPDSLPMNHFTDGSLRVRFRSCYQKAVTESMSESAWIIADTHWPDHIFTQVNGQALTVRRKQHYAKDQAVEIGTLVKAGENTICIHVPPQKLSYNGIPMVPFVAVEVVETLSHSSILNLANLQNDAIIPAEKTIAIIEKRLGRSPGNDDDDIAMVLSDLVINLKDPFSFSIFNKPVRGRDCSHLECFDLETWLNTRPGKKSCVCGSKEPNCTFCPKEPSFVDKWKCPLCSGDARPYSLRIDGFLMGIRAELATEGKLKAKLIEVSADGSWRAKVEDDDSDIDSDDDGTPAAAKRSRSSAKPIIKPAPSRLPVEVIELDDD